MYKIISNILVSRIMPYMDHIIPPYQNAFVPKRLISDNISMTHEIKKIENRLYGS